MWSLFFMSNFIAGNSRVVSRLSPFLAVGSFEHDIVTEQTGKTYAHRPPVKARGKGTMAASVTTHVEIKGADF